MARKTSKVSVLLRVAAAALLVGCQNPSGSKNPYVDPSPTPSVSVAEGADITFDSASDAALFNDPVPPGTKAGGKFFTANWKVVDGELRQTIPPTQPSLTFLTYVGNGFGTSLGQAPKHYRMDADLRAYKESTVAPEEMVGSPLGMLAIIPYYLDPTHYLLYVVTPNEVALWNVDGLAPQDTWDATQYRLWNQQITPALRAGDKIRLGAEVDIPNKMVKLFFNGEYKDLVPVPGLADQDHYVGLISNGNFVGYDQIVLKNLEATPSVSSIQ